MTHLAGADRGKNLPSPISRQCPSASALVVIVLGCPSTGILCPAAARLCPGPFPELLQVPGHTWSGKGGAGYGEV